MSMTIGRCSLTDDPDGRTIRVSGTHLAFSADITGSSVDDCLAKIFQLTALTDDSDEDVLPFTWSEDARWDGWWKVKSLSVTPASVFLSTGYASFSIDMERVPNFAAPHLETVVGSLLRTNVHAVTTPTGVLMAQYDGGSYAREWPVPVTYTWALEDGSTKVYAVAGPKASAQYSGFIRPADYYKSGCKIEVKFGSTWYPMHGAQLPIATGLNWRISNGAVRLYPTSVSGNGRFTVEQYLTGAAWSGREFGVLRSSTTFENATTDSSGNAAPVTVLINRPEVVVVRVKAASGSTAGLVSYDFTIRRGNPFVEVQIQQQYSSLFTTQAWGIGTSAVVAMTTFTGGARATANDANGLRAHIASPNTVTKDLVNGRVYLTAAASSASFSVAPDYVWGATAFTDTAFRDLYFAARFERMRVVPR